MSRLVQEIGKDRVFVKTNVRCTVCSNSCRSDAHSSLDFWTADCKLRFSLNATSPVSQQHTSLTHF